ncbi:MAG: hypothetical protein HY606_10320 [Planctomycetes bacterium]|nr:hypothetical protein [Planctomycetota bacterium]
MNEFWVVGLCALSCSYCQTVSGRSFKGLSNKVALFSMGYLCRIKFIVLILFLLPAVVLGEFSTIPEENNIVSSPVYNEDQVTVAKSYRNGVVDKIHCVWIVESGADNGLGYQSMDTRGSTTYLEPRIFNLSLNQKRNPRCAILQTDEMNEWLFIVYEEYSSNWDIKAMSINLSGSTAEPLQFDICVRTTDQYGIQISPVSASHIIIAWTDEQNGTANKDVYASSVELLVPETFQFSWTENGMPIFETLGNEINPKVAAYSDGVFFACQSDESIDYDVKLVRYGLQGQYQWTEEFNDGLNNDEINPEILIVQETTLSIIIAWQKEGNGYDIYAEKVTESGDRMWNDSGNGVVVTEASGDQINISIEQYQAPTDEFGAAFAWEDNREGNFDIYMQIIDESGQRVLKSPSTTEVFEGVLVYGNSISGQQINPIIVISSPLCRESRGYVISYENSSEGNIEVSRVDIGDDNYPSYCWNDPVVGVCTAEGTRSNVHAVQISYDSIIYFWDDERVPGQKDIYAQRVNWDGTLRSEPDAPTAELGSVTSSEVVINWRSISLVVTGFHVDRSNNPDFPQNQNFVRSTVSSDRRTRSDRDIAPGSRYYYRVGTFNDLGVSFNPNNVLRADVPNIAGCVPLPPTNLTGALIRDEILLRWEDNSNNEDGFRIYIQRIVNRQNEFVEMVNVRSNEALIPISALPPPIESMYTFAVAAYNRCGVSDKQFVSVGFQNSPTNKSIYIPNLPNIPATILLKSGHIKKPRGEMNSLCYILTAVSADNNRSNLHTFKFFRRNYLQLFASGRMFSDSYRLLAPNVAGIASAQNNTRIVAGIILTLLNPVYAVIFISILFLPRIY